MAMEGSMPASPDELFAFLDSLGIAHETVTHPPVFTVEEARDLRGAVAGGHTKNLFLRDKKGTVFLVVALENAVIELKSLHRLLGASGRFSFGSADLMRELIGVEPGSVDPFSVISPDIVTRYRCAHVAEMRQPTCGAEIHPSSQRMSVSVLSGFGEGSCSEVPGSHGAISPGSRPFPGSPTAKDTVDCGNSALLP